MLSQAARWFGNLFRGLSAGFIVLSVVSATAASAQDEGCPQVLQKAQRDYDLGRVDQIPGALKQCFNDETAPALRGRAHALLAKIYLIDDRLEEARAEVVALLRWNPEYAPEVGDPEELGRLVVQERRRRTRAQVSSVSKVDEPLREAPATVAVVTAEQIARRGYRDLEQVLHDLPGFDIARGNGEIYSNLYLRGYRSDRSDRLLLVVDGVEQNSLHSGSVYLSRQYPLTNIERIEVVYGPASTIYGSNAFTGVIHITTFDAEDVLVDGKNFGIRTSATGGEYDTRSADLTMAGKTRDGKFAWTVSGRFFESDEQDLADFRDWNFDLRDLDSLDYAAISRLSGSLATTLLENEGFVEQCQLLCRFDLGNDIIELSEAGIAKARDFDSGLAQALSGFDEDDYLGFNDHSENWSIQGKLQFSGLTLGIQSWRIDEGTTPWHNDLQRLGGNLSGRWIPEQTAVYAKYDHRLRGDLLLTFFSRYKEQRIDAGSLISRVGSYGGGALGILDLINEVPSFIQVIALEQDSSEIRSEFSFVWEPKDTFNLIGGFELRNNSIQADFRSSLLEEEPRPEIFETFFDPQINRPTIQSEILGFYAQASWDPTDRFKIVLGGRIDERSSKEEEIFSLRDISPFAEPTIEECLELGLAPIENCDWTSQNFSVESSSSVFNPRVALVYHRERFVLKAIYAEGYKAATAFQQYSREPGIRQEASPELEPEVMHNFELSFDWDPREDLSLSLVGYRALYDETVSLKLRLQEADVGFASLGGAFVNTGGIEVFGAELSAKWRLPHDIVLDGNYTYTHPESTEPTDSLNELLSDDRKRVGDIARHRLNLGASWERGPYDASLRVNWVGDRPTGVDTTVNSNPFSLIESYVVANGAFRRRGPAGTSLQLIVENLLDEEYEHPGVQSAGLGFAAVLPQPGRTLYLRFSYRR